METTSSICSLPTTSVPSISSSAMLVELNISVWTGRKFDKGVSKEIDTAKQTTTRAGNYSKKLFADEPTFEAIQKFAGNARTLHYHSTMPWSDSGLRLIPTSLYFNYVKEMSGMANEFNRLVDEFLNDYHVLVNRARVKLGSLFSSDDYPEVAVVRDKFRFRFCEIPLPDAGDFRLDINNEAQQVIKQRYEEHYTKCLEQAMREPWERMHDALKNMSNKLAGNDKQIFRNTLVTNVVEMCDLLDKFNITNDPDMKRAKQKIEDAMLGVTPDALREDDELRHDVKGKVDVLLKEFSW